MRTATAEVVIAGPLAAVHAVLVDVDAHERFLDHCFTDWKRITRQSSGVGAAVRVRIKRAQRHDKAVVRVIKSRSRRVVHETKSGKRLRRRTRGTYQLDTRSGGGTRVRYTVEFLEGGIVDRMAWPLGRRRMRRGAQTSLERLKAQVEG